MSRHIYHVPTQALASTLDEAELSDLRDQFNAMDINKDGTITLDEIKAALAKDLPWTMKEARVLTILQAVSHKLQALVRAIVANNASIFHYLQDDISEWRCLFPLSLLPLSNVH